MTRTLWAVVVGLGVSIAAGCGGSKPPGTASETGKESLEDLSRYLKSSAENGQRPPAKLADLEAIDPVIPMAGTAVRNGDIVYIWGAVYVAGGNKVIAHEKDAASAGGYVLLQDGTVKKMSAADFQAAPKAK